MSLFKKTFIFAFVLLTLSGCNKEERFNTSFLMQHPDILRKEATNCQALDEKTNLQKAQCEIVMQAAQKFMSILNEQQSQPEEFGQRVLDLQISCVASKHSVEVAQEELDALQKNPNTSQVDLNAAQTKLNQTKQDYLKKSDEVKTLLAVIGVNSPE